jgi:4-hydroxy-3-methylbut-2-enyl diphosphate reductase
VHAETRRFAAHGDTVLLVGHAGHDETEGTLGEVPGRVRLVQDRDDAENVDVPDEGRVAFVLQTTLAIDEAADTVAALRRRFPAIEASPTDDICYATTNRQRAVTAVAQDAELVLVLGSANSSNSRRLVEVAERAGTPAHLIEDASEVRPEWLHGVSCVGVTAGASAPPRLVDELLATLRGLGPIDVEERVVAREDISFSLPRGATG